MSRPVHAIVGAGIAGVSAAIAMRQAGFDGGIVLLGEEPHRPYDRPPLSKEMLAAADAPAPYLHPEGHYAALGIDVMPEARVEAVDIPAQRLRLADGRQIPYDRLLLATGGRARRLRMPGAERVLYLRTLDDALHLRMRLARAPHMTVIGAGVIGLELASTARAFGCNVTVLEAAAGPMGRAVTPGIAGFISQLHRQHGIDLRFGVQVAAIETDASGAGRVSCADGETILTDLIVAGIGVERACELATAAGLAMDSTGIIVDEFARTSVPGIFAAGDVASFWHPLFGIRLQLEAWRHAMQHGAAAAGSMCGTLEPYNDVPWFWSDQHGVNLQVGGLPLTSDQTVVRGDFAKQRFTALHLRQGRVVGVTTANQGRDIRPALTMIGAGQAVDPAALADDSIPLRHWLAK